MKDKQNPVICDVVLAYLAHSLENSSAGHVKNVCCQHFSSDEIVRARDTLWEEVDEAFLPKMVRRHNLNTMKGIELTVADIIAAFSKMESEGCSPQFMLNYGDIGRLPLSKPSETCSVSMCDRLIKLEARLEATENMVAIQQGKVADVREELDRMSKEPYSYADICSGGLWEMPKQKKHGAGNQFSLPRPNHDAEKPRRANGIAQASGDGDTRPKQLFPVSKTGHSGSLQSLASHTPSLHADGFEYPKDQRKRKRRQVVKGKKDAKDGGLRVAPEPSRDIFVYRLMKDTTEVEVTEYMTKNEMVPRAVTKVSNQNSKLASFRVEVKASLLKAALDPNSWPENVYVRRYWKRNTDVETPSGGEQK